MKAILTCAVFFFAVHALADATGLIDLKVDGKGLVGNERITAVDTGEQVSLKFSDGTAHYVEHLILLTDSSHGSATVYVDGEEVANLGVSGRDLDTPIVVRGEAKEVVIKTQTRAKLKLTGLRIGTEKKIYNSYSSMPRMSRRGFDIDQWGQGLLDLVHEFTLVSSGTPFGSDVYSRYLKPMKLAAQKIQDMDKASEKEKAVLLLDGVDVALPLLESESMAMDPRYDRLGQDLIAIKQDILERYQIEREN